MSSIKKNYTVKFLQEQLNTSSSGLKPYIIWSLARIDPYLYGLRLGEGTLMREESSWWLLENKSGVMYELLKPDNNEKAYNEEL